MSQPSRRAMSLQESAIRKLDAVMWAREGIHFHRLNIGQPDVPTPQPLLDAAAAFHPQVLAYGPASGLAKTREAAARYHSRWAPGLSAKDVVVTVGGSEAVLFAFTALCDPGDDVLVPEPYYTNYNGFSTFAGIGVRPLPTSLDDGFALPSDEALDAAIGPRTRAIIFSNPCNPTGAVYGRADLERLAAWAQRRDIWIIADEVYRRIWFDTPPTSMLELDQVQDRVIIVDSLSKTYSACGSRIGFFISRNPLLMEKIERLGQARLGPQPLAQHMALAALEMPETYYEQTRVLYQQRIDVLARAVQSIPGVSTHRPQGAFYLMARLPVEDTEAFARFMVADFQDQGETTVVAPGPGFYADPSRGRDEVRLAAVLDAPVLERAAEVLRLGLEAWKAR